MKALKRALKVIRRDHEIMKCGLDWYRTSDMEFVQAPHKFLVLVEKYDLLDGAIFEDDYFIIEIINSDDVLAFALAVDEAEKVYVLSPNELLE